MPALLVLTSMLHGVGWKRRDTGGVLDQVYHLVLRDFDRERQRQMESFFSEVSRDQALLSQLSPEAMDLFNAGTGDRPGIRYGSVVTRTPSPSLRRALRVGIDPVQQANYGLYRALYQLSAELPASALPPLDSTHKRRLENTYGDLPGPDANDSMVPTLSQLRGELVHATWSDHLDAIGHFRDDHRSAVHVDWLRSGSEFGRAQFEALWGDVADFLVS